MSKVFSVSTMSSVSCAVQKHSRIKMKFLKSHGSHVSFCRVFFMKMHTRRISIALKFVQKINLYMRLLAPPKTTF